MPQLSPMSGVLIMSLVLLCLLVVLMSMKSELMVKTTASKEKHTPKIRYFS